jgi:hypothetical protein
MRKVAMSLPRLVRRIAEMVAEKSWEPTASRQRYISDAGRTIHHPSARTAVFAPMTRRGTMVAGATKLAAARPTTSWRWEMGREASCCGSRFSSRGKMITGSVTHPAKKSRAPQPARLARASGLRSREASR